jgi:hypothetical protein
MKVDVPVREFIAALMEYGKPCDVTTGAIGHALAAVIPAIQNAALERAAVAAELYSDGTNRLHPDVPWQDMNPETKHVAHWAAQNIAATIRALKEGT